MGIGVFPVLELKTFGIGSSMASGGGAGLRTDEFMERWFSGLRVRKSGFPKAHSYTQGKDIRNGTSPAVIVKLCKYMNGTQHKHLLAL